MNFILSKHNEKILYYIVLLFLVVSISCLLVMTLTPKGVATTPDSLSYIYAAKSKASSGWMQLPDFSLDSTSFEKPMMAWPPLYPTVLSMVVSNDNPEKSLRLLNLAFLIFLSLFFILNILEFGNIKLAISGVVLLLLQVPIMTVYAYAWSETLFLPLILAAYLYTYKYIFSEKKLHILCALFFLVAGCYTRYIGLVFLIPMILMLWCGDLSHRKKAIQTIWIIAVVSGCLMPLYLRNMSLSSSFSGVVRPPSSSDFFENVTNLAGLLSLHFFGTTLWQMPVIFLSIIAAYFLIRKIKINSICVIFFPIMWAGIYFGSLIILRSWKEFDELDTRLISPAIPFLVLGLFGLIHLFNFRKFPAIIIVMVIGWIALMVILSLGSYKQALANWRDYQSPMFISTIGKVYNNFTGRPDSAFIVDVYTTIKNQTHSSNPIIILDDVRPVFFQHLSGARIKTLPDKLDIDAIQKINKLGVGVILIITPRGDQIIQAYYKDKASELFLKEDSLLYGAKLIMLPLPLLGYH